MDALIVKSQCSVFNNITTCKATSTVPGMFFATGPYAILRLFRIALGSSRTPVTSVESFINRPLSSTAVCISLFLDLGHTTGGLLIALNLTGISMDMRNFTYTGVGGTTISG